MVMPLSAIASSLTVAPRIEIYTTLTCSILRPDYGDSPQRPDILGYLHSNDYRIPTVAHQSSNLSCVDVSDVFMIDKSLQANGADTPPTRKQRCASDPVVQAAVAKLTTGAYRIVSFTCYFYMTDDPHFMLVILASMGILSCITTGWWGAVSLTVSSQTN